ncbi:HAD family hydrolase [Saccharothrix carnea]|uniref:HAD family hydrolase n=1 Tax=Saccharothrix carnea TaxID=1280637 RepID=UPI000D0D9F1D|nr:HAD-IA family hydrolase [Saccharothrix carnea]
MTTDQVPIDDPEALRRILTNTEVLLLDFDGPICSVFAGIPAHYVATQLCGVLIDGGHTNLPLDIEKTEDPFDVFRYAATLGRDEARHVEEALRAHEVEAIFAASPTSGAHKLIRAWHQFGRTLGVVSNNSEKSIHAYLRMHDLMNCVAFVVGRSTSDASELKPNPHMLNVAVHTARTPPSRCTLIGDSASDVVAAQTAGVTIVGYANKPRKIPRFNTLGADLIITRLPDPQLYHSFRKVDYEP